MNKSIILPNGENLSWADFSELPEWHQDRIMEEVIRGDQARSVAQAGGHDCFQRKALLPRIQAAAERNALKEEDILAFIKLMHDIFFPPVPMPPMRNAEILPGKKKVGEIKGFFMSLSKAVITPAGEFNSLAAAGRYYQVEGSRIRSWIRNCKPGFAYKETSENGGVNA